MTYYPPPPIADDVAQRGTKAWRDAVNARRAWTGNELWTAQQAGKLTLGNPEQLSNYLATLGITNEIGGGRHVRNLFMGNLPSEGFGMSGYRPDISHALEAYMPDWKRWEQRALQRDIPRGAAEAQFSPLGQTSPTMAAPTTSSTYNTPTPLGATSTYGGTSFGNDDETAFGLATDIFRKKRPGFTLGSMGSY